MAEDWDKKRRDAGKALAKAMADYVNDMGHLTEPFVEELVDRTHRTLNQSAMKLMFATISKMAENYEKGYFDLRNEQAMKTCSEINDHMSKNSPLDRKWGYCPCI